MTKIGISSLTIKKKVLKNSKNQKYFHPLFKPFINLKKNFKKKLRK